MGFLQGSSYSLLHRGRTIRHIQVFLQGSSYSLLHRGRTIRHIQVTPKGLAIADQEIYLTAPRLTLKYLEGNMQ